MKTRGIKETELPGNSRTEKNNIQNDELSNGLEDDRTKCSETLFK